MKKLMIPEFISLEKEYLPGIGPKELKQLLLSVLPGVAVAAAVWLLIEDPVKQLVTMVLGIGYVILCYMTFTKIDKRQSIYTYIAKIVRFRRNQKTFYYRQEKEVIRFAEEKD